MGERFFCLTAVGALIKCYFENTLELGSYRGRGGKWEEYGTLQHLEARATTL